MINNNRNTLLPDIIYEYDQWKTIENLESFIAETVSLTSSYLKLHDLIDFVDFSIVLTNDSNIQTLNKEYRNIDKPTNVLSLPIEEIHYSDLLELKKLNKSSIGDIIISYDTITREINEQNKKFEDHFKHLLIHSILHLFGFSHEDDEEAKIMENVEVEILKEMKICSPYD